VSEVTAKGASLGVPAHITGLAVETLNGEDVAKSSYDELLAKIKGAGRPLSLVLKGAVDPALMPKGTPPASPIIASKKSAPSSPGLSAGIASMNMAPSALPQPAPGAPAFNFNFAAPTAAPQAPLFSFGSTPAGTGLLPQQAAAGDKPLFNFAAPAAPAPAPEGTSQFNFGAIDWSQAGADDDDDDDDDEEDEEEDDEEEDDEEDDCWLFKTVDDVEVEEIMEGFGLPEGTPVMELNPKSWKTMQDAAEAVVAAASGKGKGKEGKKGKKGKKNKGKGSDVASAKVDGDPVEAIKDVFRPLCKKGMLLVVEMEEVEEGSALAQLTCQMLQCVDAMFEDLAEEEDGGEVAGVLVHWEGEEICGPSIDPADEGAEVSLTVADLDDDEDEGGWVFTAEEAEEYDSLKEDFGIFEDGEPVVQLDASKWTGLKSVVEALREATSKGSAPGKQKGGIQKLLVKNLKPLCKAGMLLVITNTAASKSDVVCHFLQVLEGVFEELEEELGKVLCVLPGWEDDSISGPSLDDPSELVGIPVLPVSALGGLGGMNEMSPEEVREAMIKAGYVLDDISDDDDDDDDQGEIDVEAALEKIKLMQIEEGQHKKKDKKKSKK